VINAAAATAAAAAAADSDTCAFCHPLISPTKAAARFRPTLRISLTSTAAAAAAADSGTCAFRHPLIFPNKGGSTLFVYHADAAKEMREFSVRRGEMAALGKRARLSKLWNEVAGMQLGATLTYLNPANSIGLFTVTVNTTGAAVGRKMRM
jgi:hypothetical protein